MMVIDIPSVIFGAVCGLLLMPLFMIIMAAIANKGKKK